MERDEVLICWCVMRQLETENAEMIADIMGTTESRVLLLMAECGPRFKENHFHPSLFAGAEE